MHITLPEPRPDRIPSAANSRASRVRMPRALWMRGMQEGALIGADQNARSRMIRAIIKSHDGQTIYESDFAELMDAICYCDGVFATDDQASSVSIQRVGAEAPITMVRKHD